MNEKTDDDYLEFRDACIKALQLYEKSMINAAYSRIIAGKGERNHNIVLFKGSIDQLNQIHDYIKENFDRT